MAHAIAEGAGDLARMVRAEDADADVIVDAAGVVFICPENLGSMSGIMKDMFDRTYYGVLGKVEGRAYATAIAAGTAGQGAGSQIDRIVTGWRLRRVADPLIVNLEAQSPESIRAWKTVTAEDLERCHDLGKAFAEGIRISIY